MKIIERDSKEFKRILHNLSLENFTLHPTLQKKALDIVNSDVKITPNIIKEALKHGEV